MGDRRRPATPGREGAGEGCLGRRHCLSSVFSSSGPWDDKASGRDVDLKDDQALFLLSRAELCSVTKKTAEGIKEMEPHLGSLGRQSLSLWPLGYTPSLPEAGELETFEVLRGA